MVVVSGSVGAGHDGVARELASRLRGQGHDVDVLDLLEGFPSVVKVLLGSAYLLTLRWAPWAYELTCWLVERSAAFQRLADAVCCSGSRWLRPGLADADLVVATYPPAARALGHLRASGDLRVPAVTYLTDPAANFLWVHPAVDLHLTLSAATAQEAERRYAVPMVSGGPLVDPVFRNTDPACARAHLREVAGLDRDERVALLVLGSLGVGDVTAAVRALCAAGLRPVVLCGRNEALRERVSRLPGAVALGWRTDGPLLVTGADLLVHNAGGLSLTEGLVAGTPSLTFAPLAGHGRANARSLERAGTVRWARTQDELTRLARSCGSGPVAPVWPESEETAVARICALLEQGLTGPGQAPDCGRRGRADVPQP